MLNVTNVYSLFNLITWDKLPASLVTPVLSVLW